MRRRHYGHADTAVILGADTHLVAQGLEPGPEFRGGRRVGPGEEAQGVFPQRAHRLLHGHGLPYDRRIALGLSQAELAERAGMTQPQVSRTEGGDTVPTLLLLRRLAKALDGTLNLSIDEGDSRVTFTPHAT